TDSPTFPDTSWPRLIYFNDKSNFTCGIFCRWITTLPFKSQLVDHSSVISQHFIAYVVGQRDCLNDTAIVVHSNLKNDLAIPGGDVVADSWSGGKIPPSEIEVVPCAVTCIPLT